MTSNGYFLYAGLGALAVLIIVCAVLFSKYGTMRKKHLKTILAICAASVILCVFAGASALAVSAPKPELISHTNQDELYAHGIVYYTPNGSVYHFTDHCTHLSHAKTVLCGTVDDAAKNGAERACSKCSSVIRISN